jgi:hypothetical protein
LRVLENRVLRGIFRTTREEVAGDWRRLHNKELYNLYTSPNTIRVIKSRMMRWAWHVVRMGEIRNAYKILAGKLEGKRPLGRPSVDRKVILDWNFGKYGGKVRTGCMWFRIGTSGRLS